MKAGVIFDAEGVVIDTERIWDEAQLLLLRESGRSYDRQTVKPLLTGRSSLEGARVLKDHYDLEATAESVADRRTELFIQCLTSDVGFVPGFLDFFHHTVAGHKSAIATAMDPALFELVDRRLHLNELFAGQIFTLVDAGYRSKPDPELFLVAARALGLPPSECVVIEDSPYGIEAARRAGMRCIGLATTYAPEQLASADTVAKSFADIPPSVLDIESMET